MANTHINMLSKMLQSDDGEASVMVDQSEENIRCSLQLSDVVCSQPGEDDSPDAAMHQEVLLLLKGLTDFFNKKVSVVVLCRCPKNTSIYSSKLTKC